jgi:uncharacterized protein (DUF488 family)
VIYTIGHSIHSIEAFIRILKAAGVTAVADVRSAPYSRYQPQFNRDALEKSLRGAEIEYVFLGVELGGRSPNESDFEDGRVVYSRLRQRSEFDKGLERVIAGSQKFVLALMCTEKEPLDCHRTLLVAQALTEQGVEMSHIHSDSSLETHDATIQRLLKMHKLDEEDLFGSHHELVSEAILKQEQKIAYTSRIPGTDRIEENSQGAA